jgi:hypothetical protein
VAVGTYGSVNFTDACNAHDTCYGTCNPQDADGTTNQGKATCDVKFKDDLENLCRQDYPNSLYGKVCILLANTFYNAVVDKGTKSYAEGQTEGCGCCDDCYCASLTCTPAQILNRDTCTCVCPTQCPKGQSQDPKTCKCTKASYCLTIFSGGDTPTGPDCQGFAGVPAATLTTSCLNESTTIPGGGTSTAMSTYVTGCPSNPVGCCLWSGSLNGATIQAYVCEYPPSPAFDPSSCAEDAAAITSGGPNALFPGTNYVGTFTLEPPF